MGVSKRKEPNVKDPLQPENLFLKADAVPYTFGNVTTKPTVRQLGSFNPNEYKYAEVTPYDDISVIERLNARGQPLIKQAENMLQQFGANFVSGFGQGLANLLDVSSWGNDNYQSSLFGLSTKDMQEWAEGVAKRNKILRENPGEFDPGSFGWWMEQTASAGTGLGMGAFALAETAAIELATGGLGTGAALARLGNVFKNIRNARGVAGVVETANAVRDLRSAATVFGVANRLNESRMEAMMSYNEIYDSMAQEKNPDGTAKYTQDQLENFAAAGADRTFKGNLALLPLDILAYRTMVYNPISGSGAGIIERTLSGIGNKWARKAVQGTVFAGLEGTEEGFQFVASQEGKHYAQVLGGQDDGSTFMQRLGQTVQQDEFWNNFAGGVIGSPIIGGAMNLTNKIISGNRTAKLNSIHNDYVQNIARMDNAIANRIKEYQENGETEKADILRRQFRANKAISALHLDAMTDRDTAFEAHVNFLEGTLEEVNQGKFDALNDLGITNPTQEQIDYIKKNFQDSINDAKEIQGIYENVKNRYNKNFVPEIVNDYFQLNRLTSAQAEVAAKITALQSKLPQFGQLSPQGKELYNTEYQLKSLQLEQARLTEEFRAATDEQEKQNINQVMDANKVKITSLKSRLGELNKDDLYTQEQRTLDNDILQSALLDKNYSQAMYDKERLDNEISLKRKNISLWNNKEYLAKKNAQSISRATNRQQVENTEQELARTGEVAPETQQAIEDKKNELAAQQAAAVVTQETDEGIPGNANLFAEDNNLIDSINNTVNNSAKVPSTDPENPNGVEVEYLLAPADFDFNNVTPEARVNIINGVRGLVDRIQGEPSFENLVRHIIRVQGETVADNMFNALKWGWEQAGFVAEDYQAIYDRVFGNPMELLMQGVQGLSVRTPQQLERTNDQVTEQIAAEQQEPVGVTPEGQPAYKYTGFVTNESSPKFAFVSRLNKLVRETDESGQVIVSHEYTEDELNQGDYVDSLQLLDPDKWTEGTEAVIEIPSNYSEIKIPVYNSDGTKGQAMTFGQYVAQNNLTPAMQEYQDKVPMIIYRKGRPKSEKGVAFVHDIGWYHPLRFHQEFKDSMDNAIRHTREIRKAVLASEKNSEPIVITGKRQTTFAGLKTQKGTDITLREANPQSQLTIALTTDSLSTSKTNRVFPNNDTQLINKTPFVVGRVYDVRRYGKEGEVDTFVALDIIKPKLDTLSKATVMQALNIYANRSNKNQDIRARHDAIAKQIQDTMGLDIFSNAKAGGLMSYLSHFIYVHNALNLNDSKQAEERMKGLLPAGTPYVAFIGGGNIVMGKAGEAAYTSNGKKVFSVFLNPNMANPILTGLGYFRDNMLNWYEQNLSLDNLNRNAPIVTIDSNLNAATTANTYNDFLIDRYRTNMRSVNIGTPEQPNYITNIQPVITYDLASAVRPQAPTIEEVRQEVVPPTVTPAVEEAKDLTELEKELIERAKRELGSDYNIGTGTNQELFAPAELTNQQRSDIARSVNRIAGLTPDQQFDIVDFMYNQITTMVNLETTQVTRAEVDRRVSEAFKAVVDPLKTLYTNRINELTQLIQQHPALAQGEIPNNITSYRYRLNKIASIEQSMDVLKEEAYNRVAKYTGITQSKIEPEAREEEEVPEAAPDVDAELEQEPSAETERIEDVPSERERDFWTDVLQENPESRVSYAMRRFFGNVRKYDKNGNPMTGFLGLPVYTGSDTIIRTLMVTLADVPSDFQTMIDKLEEVKRGIPWMQEVINKLNGATQQQKNQFVTVMSNTKLRMKFTMISFDRRTNSWTTKVWDTHMTGVADAVRAEWMTNFKDSPLTLVDDEGNYTLNAERARVLVSRFEDWVGRNLPDVQSGMDAYRPEVDRVKVGKPVTITVAGALLNELRANLKTPSDRMKFSMKNQKYQIRSVGEGKYEIAFLRQGLPDTAEEKTSFEQSARDWLNNFGVVLSDETFRELMERGMYHNYQQRKPNELFYVGDGTMQSNGLFAILYLKLKSLLESPGVNFTQEGNSPLEDTVIKSLANLEAKYNTVNTPFGFREAGKSFFALTAPKFITDRARDLKSTNDEVRRQLGTVSFSKDSFWLKLLADSTFRDKFQVSHIGANAFKELGKKLYRDNAITKLSDVDHELTKLGMFWDTAQGEIRYGTQALSTYPGSNVEMRMGTVFSPTMSDKHIVTLVTTAILNLRNAELNNGAGINAQVNKIIYEQTVRPELQRMVRFAQLQQAGTQFNISDYDKGAGLFMLMPAMNNIEYSPGLRLIDAIKHQPNHFTVEYIEQNEEMMNAFATQIDEYVKALTAEKMEAWKKTGIVGVDAENNVTGLNYIDRRYKERNFRGTGAEVAKMAAMDFVVNYLIANANSFMLFAGDPAMYFKSKSADPFIKAMDSFVNVGKRLANQIAPGTPLSNSEHEKYLQVFLSDRKSLPEIPFLKFVTKVNDGEEISDNEIETLKTGTKAQREAIAEKYPVSAGYFGIEGSDAQEYTTWQEHLDILTKLGRTPDTLVDITPEEIAEARELFSSGVSRARLTDRQKQLIGKVLQPIKPVYTGQLYDPQQDVMRTIYIKSSSFPLIPQLTAGMEIDKLRDAMEKLQRTSKLSVRASYQTANKVGSINTPMEIWTPQGTINEEALKAIGQSSLILDRKNFRIQQEVPFKSAKVGEDKITLGTQLMKLLFGDEIMNMDGFAYNGRKYVGAELHRVYNDLFDKLVREKRQQLFDELGLDAAGNPLDAKKSVTKLQSLLKDEAVKRGYPLQDIEGLTLTERGEFNLPLWASTNSNRYESMLNSIISNRLIRMKFPGNSFIVGSEEGFIKQENLEGVDQSKIVWTSAWNGRNLQAAYFSNGELKKAQVLISSKFKTPEGELIDLFTKVGSEYKYITQTDTGFMLKESMFDKDLLSLVSFRIPTSGHQSASQIEIAGFLPAEAADLMIVPRNFTKQKGLDFDVDKENAYQLWTYMNEEGKFEVLQEKHRTAILAKADRALEQDSKGSIEKLFTSIFGDISEAELEEYTSDEISADRKLSKLNSKITEKLLQNEIIKINHSVMGSDNARVQAKINKTLNTDFAEAQAEFIDQLSQTTISSNYWTPLSDEYQKQKMMSGASGKIGTGAYSLDVVFHSLAQQAAVNGRPIQLIEVVGEGEDMTRRPKSWRFGTISSNGELGSTVTLDGGRSISEVMAERQNVAVDNEKLQIMGRVNLNDITMDVDKVMNMIGFDKGRDGNSISMLFLSQPIVKEFVERLKNSGSTVGEYIANREETIYSDLLAEYEGDAQVEVNDDYWEVMSDLMTNDNMINAIRAGKDADKRLQAAVLRRFAEMRKYGLAIRGIQVTINTDSKGLGKSFFDVIEKRNALNRLGVNTNFITGASGLIGDYIEKESLDTEQRDLIQQAGYVDIGKYFVKPDTLSGSFNIYGVSTAYNLWSKYFPYDANVTQQAFTEVLSVIGSDGMSETRTVELKQEIFRHMKKYFAGSRNNKIMNSEDDINAERARLYIDSDTNTSLAKYLKTIKAMSGNEAVNTFIKTNQLINRFEFDIQKNGLPSLIKFSNAAGEEFDEQYLYESLTSLMELRGASGKVDLPEVGNKKYTLDTLAQDLINYCYLGNVTQEAIQFTKYVPIAYLNQVDFTGRMRAISGWLTNNPNILGIRAGGQEETQSHLVSEFAMQYVQHNPERLIGGVSKFNIKEVSKLINRRPDGSFTFKDQRTPPFVSIYEPNIPKGEKKFRLYWFDGEKYTKIPVLGVFGMDEYQIGNYIGQSLVNERVPLKAEPQPTTNQESQTGDQPLLFDVVQTGDSYKITQAIANTGTTLFSPLANFLLPFSSDVKVVVDDSMQMGDKIVHSFNGHYNPTTKTITIHPDIVTNPDKLADTFIHELVHHLTYHAVNKYIESNPTEGLVTLKTNDAPFYVQDLVRLYNSLKSNQDLNKIKEVAAKIGTQGLTRDEKGNLYGYISIHEFMAMALTNPDFQKVLSQVEYKNTGQSLLERFKQVISAMLKAIGVDFKSDTAAAHAINSIFTVIERNNLTVEDNPWQGMYDETMNGFDEFSHNTDNPEGQFNPEDSAEKKKLLIEAENALKAHMKEPFLSIFLGNVDLALQEAAAQLNSSKSEAETARKFYGNDFSDIALKVYPDETVQAKAVRDYINKLNSDQKDC